MAGEYNGFMSIGILFILIMCEVGILDRLFSRVDNGK